MPVKKNPPEQNISETPHIELSIKDEEQFHELVATERKAREHTDT